MDKFTKLFSDIGKLLETYLPTYLNGIGNTLILAVVATLGMGSMIGAISGFSFLGLGVQPPYAEWGALLADSRFYFPIAPWLLIVPAVAIFFSVLAANLIGNGLRDVLEPRGRS